jgi:hypothetical protein
MRGVSRRSCGCSDGRKYPIGGRYMALKKIWGTKSLTMEMKNQCLHRIEWVIATRTRHVEHRDGCNV